jgi:hypothetical protein
VTDQTSKQPTSIKQLSNPAAEQLLTIKHPTKQPINRAISQLEQRSKPSANQPSNQATN